MTTKTEERQSLMIETMWEKNGNITEACKAANVSRQTHYNWLDEFDDYKRQIRAVEESLIDRSESVLHELISDKNVVATIFHLKTKGQSRGYIEKQQVENSGETVHTVKVVEIPSKQPMPDASRPDTTA